MASILDLPNEILIDILSLIPEKERTRISKVCRRFQHVIAQVKKKTRPQQLLSSDGLLSLWDPVNRQLLIDPDVQICNEIQLNPAGPGTNLDQLIQVLSAFPNFMLYCDSVSVYESYAGYFATHPEHERLIHERIYCIDLRDGHESLLHHLHVKLVNLKQLTVWEKVSGDELQQILNHFPKLTDLKIRTDLLNIRLLWDSAPHISALKFTNEGQADVFPLFRFLELKGQHLRYLELRGKVTSDQACDFVAIVSRNCHKLKNLTISRGFILPYELEWDGTGLFLCNFAEANLEPVIACFPRMRYLDLNEIPAASDLPLKLETWIQELKEFAVTKKDRKVCAKIYLPSATAREVDDHNLKLVVKVS